MACRDFCLDTGQYPGSLNELVNGTGIKHWHGPYLDTRLPHDPWGRPFGYDPPNDPSDVPDVFTFGADGQPGGTGENSDFHTRPVQ